MWGVFVATRTIASTLVPCCLRDREGCVTAKLSLLTCAKSLTTHCSPARSWQWLLSTRLVNDSWLTNSTIPHHSPCLPSCLGSLVSQINVGQTPLFVFIQKSTSKYSTTCHLDLLMSRPFDSQVKSLYEIICQKEQKNGPVETEIIFAHFVHCPYVCLLREKR